MTGVVGGERDADIDLPRLFRAIWQKRGRVAVATLGVAALAFAGASLLSPKYRSETRLLVEPRGVDRSQPIDPTALDDLGVGSQVQLLQSADLLRQVVRNLNLQQVPELDPASTPSVLSDLLVLLGARKNPLDVSSQERVLDAVEDRLAVYQVDRSRIIGVQFTSKDPKLAALVPNEIARVYLSLQAGAKLDSDTETTRWLEPQLESLRGRVQEAEEKVAQYRTNSDLLPAGDDGTVSNRQLGDISAELTRVRGEKANAQARVDSVRTALANGRSVDNFPDVIGSATIQRLKETESLIQGQIAEQSITLLEGHPRIKGLRSQLSGVRQQIREETAKILSSVENEVNVAELRERELEQQVNALKATSAQEGESSVGLRALEREANAQRQLLETYLSRYREAASRTDQSATPADARIVSQAVEPSEPYFPKVLPITLVAGLATFLLYTIAIMMQELFSGRAYRTPGERTPEASPSIPADPLQQTSVAGVPAEPLPVADRKPEMVDHGDYGIMAVSSQLIRNTVPLAICVSPAGDEGSAATVMLARHIADAGRRVVLVDLTGSAYPSQLMAESDDLAGLTDLLTGDIAFADGIHADRLSQAHIIPQGTADAGVAMRSVDRLSLILEALANVYDTVLVESGPASIAGVRRLTHGHNTKIIVSAYAASEERVSDLIAQFAQAGYDDIVLMTEGTGPGGPQRKAA
ncbi:chain-length determining protein [Rhizobium sp. CFBP 8762]|uniref:GumC family protein n=1 Tax=Rhizobium sp. CFBP 8762 TaxID=2775279 RepID=UPI00177E9A59|nr:Wzz/FepE/Etk N-terminal domain-containing protein [Rhizobium sp. CFBP 8762]MBD8552991.1 chain-length determining protein [Rhizobium sp. CFBP 8762]